MSVDHFFREVDVNHAEARESGKGILLGGVSQSRKDQGVSQNAGIGFKCKGDTVSKRKGDGCREKDGKTKQDPFIEVSSARQRASLYDRKAQTVRGKEEKIWGYHHSGQMVL